MNSWPANENAAGKIFTAFSHLYDNLISNEKALWLVDFYFRILWHRSVSGSDRCQGEMIAYYNSWFKSGGRVWCLMPLSTISVVLWQWVLLVEETWVPEKTTDLSQVTDKRYHIMLSSTPRYGRDSNSQRYWR